MMEVENREEAIKENWEEIQSMARPANTETASGDPVMEAPPAMSDEQNALLVFQSHINMFISKLNNYQGSKSQIVRAWTNAAISPLNKDALHFSYPEEQELFDLYTELNSAKFILMVHGMVRDGKLEIKRPLLEGNETPASEVELAKTMETLGDEAVNNKVGE
jgi:hypothetical protein